MHFDLESTIKSSLYSKRPKIMVNLNLIKFFLVCSKSTCKFDFKNDRSQN